MWFFVTRIAVVKFVILNKKRKSRDLKTRGSCARVKNFALKGGILQQRADNALVQLLGKVDKFGVGKFRLLMQGGRVSDSASGGTRQGAPPIEPSRPTAPRPFPTGVAAPRQ